MECVHGDNRGLAESLQIGIGLDAAVSILDKGRKEYMVFSKDQRISIAIIQDRGYVALQPIYILVRSTKDPDVRLVREDELLTLTFDGKGQLIDKSCKTIYTGL